MVSPTDVLNKIESKGKRNGLKPVSSKKGLSSMFSPSYASSSNDASVKEDVGLQSIPSHALSDTKKKQGNLKREKKSIVRKELRENESLNLPVLKVGGGEVSVEQFSLILNLSRKLYAHDLKLLSAILIKTEFGRVENVCLSSNDIVEYGLSAGRSIKESRENLERFGLICSEEAFRSDEARRKSYFYSLCDLVID
jgi:hypothetical protein